MYECMCFSLLVQFLWNVFEHPVIGAFRFAPLFEYSLLVRESLEAFNNRTAAISTVVL